MSRAHTSICSPESLFEILLLLIQEFKRFVGVIIIDNNIIFIGNSVKFINISKFEHENIYGIFLNISPNQKKIFKEYFHAMWSRIRRRN